jgi:hypothetical protein
MKCLCIGALLVIGAATTLRGDTVTWSWAKANFTPCPGLGIHGSYRVTARANVVGAGTSKKINGIDVFASSPVFSSSDTTLAVKVEATSVPAPTDTILMVTQPPNSVAETPQANETPRMFLPANKEIPLTANLKLRFTVTPTIQRSSGSCAVGESVKEIDPNLPPNAPENR